MRKESLESLVMTRHTEGKGENEMLPNGFSE